MPFDSGLFRRRDGSEARNISSVMPGLVPLPSGSIPVDRVQGLGMGGL